jgi:endogenous inhibitor of DNA gyrase (YacG/DUF329 family)
MVRWMARCPICGRSAALREQNPAFPFCGVRCKQIDLGKWLDEQYRVAGDAESPQQDADTDRPGDDA